MNFKKVITIGEHTVGVTYDEDEELYILTDNYTGRYSRFSEYGEAIEEMQVVVCDLLNEYFSDVAEPILVS